MNSLPPSLNDIGNTMDKAFTLLMERRKLHEISDDLRTLIYGSMSGPYRGVKAAAETELFLRAIPALQQSLKADILAALRHDPAAKAEEDVISYYPGFRAVFLQRMANVLFRSGIPSLPRGITEYAHRITGIDIHPGATIGEGFFIDHGTGVVIGETAHIGNDVTLYQGVTLGAKSFKHDDDGNVIREEKRHPTVEDRVVIYANATILGGQTVIGHDAIIGGGVWLTESVEPGARVMLSPPTMIKKPQRDA